MNNELSDDSSRGSSPLLESDYMQLQGVNGDWSLEDDEDPDAPKISKKTEIFEGQVVQVE